LNYTRAAKRRFVHQNRYNFKIWWRGEDDSGHPALHPTRVGLRPFKFVPDEFVEPFSVLILPFSG